MPVYTNTVVARNEFGRFIKACEEAATATVKDMLQEGANVAAGAAPKRTGALAASIQPFMLTATSGVWGSNLKYAAPQETGASPHDLPANVTFFWEKAGRMWMPPDVYQRVTGYPGNDPIRHPGNPATNYLSYSVKVMKPRITAIAKRHYPG